MNRWHWTDWARALFVVLGLWGLSWLLERYGGSLHAVILGQAGLAR